MSPHPSHPKDSIHCAALEEAARVPPSSSCLPGSLLRLAPDLEDLRRQSPPRALWSIPQQQRLEAVEWWGAAAVTRDYVRLWLQGITGGFEAVAYVDRNTGKRYLQAVAD